MEYNIGDIVKIREWEDMKNEFGECENGYIMCPFNFIKSMAEFCGRVYRIVGIEMVPYWDTQRLILEEVCDIGSIKYTVNSSKNISSYQISPEMVELLTDEKIPDNFIAPDINILF